MYTETTSEKELRLNKQGLGFIEASCLWIARKIAIDFAGIPNPENYNACALWIYDDGTYYIGERTYSNVSFSPTMTTGKAFVIMTVSATDYPVKELPYKVAHFCAHYGIKLSDQAPPTNVF